MKTYIITGANSGLGFETAKRIAKKGYRLILACRNMEKGSEAADTIKSETGNVNIESRPLDLASLDSVRNFAEGLKGTAIYALDNNAGNNAREVAKSAPRGFARKAAKLALRRATSVLEDVYWEQSLIQLGKTASMGVIGAGINSLYNSFID
jgi:NAD(P)-dependent dehydrogenase (short-subunit alcohol dehydrogenase family)